MVFLIAQDVDSYIHRSGRTGRAGREGMSVLFYKPKEEYDLQCVERKAVSLHLCEVLLFSLSKR